MSGSLDYCSEGEIEDGVSPAVSRGFRPADFFVGDGRSISEQPEEWQQQQEEEERDSQKNQRSLSLLGRSLHVPRNSVCGNSTIHSVQSMRSGDATRKNTKILLENPNLFARALSEKLTGPWIEHAFEKRECVKFIPLKDNTERCGCGRLVAAHSQLAQSRFSVFSPPVMVGEGWSIDKHTHVSPTDGFGTLVFQGGAHAHKAQYVRLGYDSSPADIMYLMEKVWGLQPPRLVITVHGGTTNFQVQEKVGRLFREGLLKAAQTTGAWILTSGIDSGIVRHVAQALDEAGISARMRSKIITIGFAPWGVLRKRERLISKDQEVQYDSHSFSSSSGLGILNDRHSYFLLADNGTSGRYGADQHLRQNFENYLASQSSGPRHVPVVAAVLEGGTSTIKAVHQYVTKEPDIPVIVCDGSGRASDLLSFACRYVEPEGVFPREIREQLSTLTAAVFPETPKSQLDQYVGMLVESAQRPDLLTIFRLGEEDQTDVDHAILTAVLKGHNLSLPEQLQLTLSWNRVDVARSCCFSCNNNWPIGALHCAMNDALRLNRVEFVELLLENGVSMKTFLTLSSLEQLYNQDDDTQHSVRIFIEKAPSSIALTLPDIGLIIERLMGNAYKHYYTSRDFKSNYDRFRKKAQLSRLSSFHIRLVSKSPAKRRKSGETRGPISEAELRNDFSFPYNDLMLWAILTRRPEMARCMWLHGEDAMAKGLAAIRLYKAIGKIAEEEYLEVEVANKLREHAEEFRSECHQLLDYCYREDNEQTLRLLTAELPHWGHHNCLSLAVLANNKQFLAHPCCQMLLADLWHGSLRVRSGSNVRVLTSLLFPPAALFLAFKTPRVQPEEPQDNHSEQGDPYETVSSFHTNDKSSMGSMLSIPLNKLFKTHPSKCRSTGLGEEAEELMENGVGAAKKVTIVSSKKNSAVFLTEPQTDISSEPEIPTMSSYVKLRAFYSAPITKFWSWCIAFHIFLGIFTYVLLIETPVHPTNIEWAMLVYVISFGCEHLRKLCCQETPRFWNKVRMFYSRYYNFLTLIALLLFGIGFVLRLNPVYRHSWGRVILSCSNVLWYMKVLEFLSVHPLLGPYIQMAAKMVVSMCYIIVLLLVTLMAFGVSRQAITYPRQKEFEWILVRNIFYKPYFMLYGEVYAGEIDTCGDEDVNCVPGYFIPPLLMTIFLLVANILLINMLIAIFNNIFNETNVRSKEVWLFQRYGQIMDYNDTPLLPPPLTTLSHIMCILCKCCKCCRKKTGPNQSQKVFLDFSMKLNLTPEELREIHDFEEDCMDELTRKKLRRGQGTPEERWTQAIEQSEVLSGRLNELILENFSLRNRLCEMEGRLDWIVKNQTEMLTFNKPTRRRSVNFRASSGSLHDHHESISPLSTREPFMDNLLTPVDELRLSVRSPLVQNLRRDQLQKRYDEARFQSPMIQRRPRLNSSSLSISQDMRDMNRSKKCSISVTSSEDDEQPSVHGPWTDNQ